MKVTLGNDTYLVHWETRKFSPKTGRNTEMELEATDCIIRTPSDADGNGSVEVSRGHVSQTACDRSNSVTARRLSFLKAIKGFDRLTRKAFGDEFNRNCRVVPRTAGQTNRKLKKRIAELTAQVAELKKSEEVLA